MAEYRPPSPFGPEPPEIEQRRSLPGQAFDAISQVTQPIRDLSDSSGNTKYWRNILSNPHLAMAIQFATRSPTGAARDAAMANVLNRRAGGPAQTSGLAPRVGPDEVGMYGIDPRALPPIREGYSNSSHGLAQLSGVNPAGSIGRKEFNPSGPARNPDELFAQLHDWHKTGSTNGMPRGANDRAHLSPFDRAALDQRLKRGSLKVVD